MPVYIVAYDLNDRGKQDYEGLKERLTQYKGYCHAQKSVWLVVTDRTAKQITNDLASALDAAVKDKLLVVKAQEEKQPEALNWDYRPFEGESSEEGTVADWRNKWLKPAAHPQAQKGPLSRLRNQLPPKQAQAAPLSSLRRKYRKPPPS